MNNEPVSQSIKNFKDCPALDGYHCQTNSLAKIFRSYGHPVSEDMLLGIGSGMGFIYWHQKGTLPFLGGRANVKIFFTDIGKRTRTEIKLLTSTSPVRAENRLLEMVKDQKPVMVFGDMAYLPWFDFPEEYHFGGHTFVICGYDGDKTLLASDIDPKASGLKRGIYSPITLEELKKARSSTYKPFPPHNAWLEFDFSKYRFPDEQDILGSIKQTARSMLNPPITNTGIKGFMRTAKEMLRWPSQFDDDNLKISLFNIYIYIEIGGTGGGCFRYMYSRFLKESSEILSDRVLSEASDLIFKSGIIFSEIAGLFKDMEHINSNKETLIKEATFKFKQIAEIEENAFTLLNNIK